jgi:hypothetical protein
MVANDRTDALPRSGAVAGGFCGALSAVLLLAAYFFRILLTAKLQTDLKPFREIFAQTTTAFQPLQRYRIFEFLASFFMNFSQYIQIYQNQQLMQDLFSKVLPFRCCHLLNPINVTPILNVPTIVHL